MNFYLRCLAWLVLIAILAVTVGPLNLRPVTGEPVNLERFFAFFIVGLLFAIAYPRHWLAVLMLVVGSAALFELLQRLAPGRHGEIIDFVIKAVGGFAGVFLGSFVRRVFRIS